MKSNNPNHKKNLKPFKKGYDERRNLEGAPPKLPQLDVLLDEVLGEEKNGVSAAKLILIALRLKAKKGDVRAAELLLDRAFGKAKQTLDLSGTVNSRDLSALTDDQLIAARDIARILGGSDGAV